MKTFFVRVRYWSAGVCHVSMEEHVKISLVSTYVAVYQVRYHLVTANNPGIGGVSKH